jgi:hypothetical protein
MKCYVLIASEWESFMLLGVFKDKKQAEDLKEICQEYEKSKPKFPEYNKDAEIDEKEMDEYDKKVEEWVKNHPSGKDTRYYDTFNVQEQEYIE